MSKEPVTTTSKVLVAIPTRGLRDLRRLAHSMRSLPADWDPVFFLNGEILESPAANAFQKDSTIPVVELARSGYASVRNAIFDWAKDYSLLVFFDDDQLPCLGWAEALAGAYQQSEAKPDVIIGPLISVGLKRAFIAAEWSRGQERLLQETRLWDGPAYSGNTLIDLNFVRSKQLRFEPRFDLDGGEDTAFFRSLQAHGGRVQFEPNALAIEIVDLNRLTARGVYRAGKTSARRNVVLDDESKRVTRRVIGHAVRATGLTLISLATVDRAGLASAIHSFGMLVQYSRESLLRGTASAHIRTVRHRVRGEG